MKKLNSTYLGTVACAACTCFATSAFAYDFDTHAALVRAAVAATHYWTPPVDAQQWCPTASDFPPDSDPDFSAFKTASLNLIANLSNLKTGLDSVETDVSMCNSDSVTQSGDYLAKGYYDADNLDHMGSFLIKDFRYIVKRDYTKPCGLQAIPDNKMAAFGWRVPGAILGTEAADVDNHLNDTVLWVRPTNMLFADAALSLASGAVADVSTLTLLPFACFISIFTGDNCWKTSSKLGHQYNPVEESTGWIPGIGHITSGDYVGLWHFINTNNGWNTSGPYTSYNVPPGMEYEQAGPYFVPGVIDEAILIAGWASGLSLNAKGSDGVSHYGQYDDVTRDWIQWQAHTVGTTEFSPVDNLALYGKNVYDSQLSNGKHSSAYGLGWPLHALGDASAPQHIAGTTSYGHRPLEDAINDTYKDSIKFDTTDPSASTVVGNDTFSKCHPPVEIVQKAYDWWKYYRLSSGGHVDVRDLVQRVATNSRGWINSHQSVYYDMASLQYFLGDLLDDAQKTESRNWYKSADYNGNGMSLAEFSKTLLIESSGAILAYLLDASLSVAAQTQDPATKCPSNTHFVHSQGCQPGPSALIYFPTGPGLWTCSNPGQKCLQDLDCCSGLSCALSGANAGTCMTTPTGCSMAGSACAGNSDCCDQLNLSCLKKACVNLNLPTTCSTGDCSSAACCDGLSCTRPVGMSPWCTGLAGQLGDSCTSSYDCSVPTADTNRACMNKKCCIIEWTSDKCQTVNDCCPITDVGDMTGVACQNQQCVIVPGGGNIGDPCTGYQDCISGTCGSNSLCCYQEGSGPCNSTADCCPINSGVDQYCDLTSHQCVRIG